ncbi:MAG: NUDIX domain-containing protein [Aurantimicrobium sp.]|nr:NUDIX domain-containing protein [Aurantimicrobium sp.]
MSRPAHRRISRVLLFDEHKRLLLMKTASPSLAVPVIRWITPGGGADDHESHSQGAIRELFEETGLLVTSVGEPVWAVSGESRFADGHVQTTHAEFFAVHTQSFEPVDDNWMPNEFSDIHDVRWWHLDDLGATDEPFGPLNLVELARAVLVGRDTK